jgi:hypothetical protein
LLSVAIPGAAVAADPGEQLLLERANFWRQQHRLDLAGDILNKILSQNPTQPDALYAHGSLALEQGRPGEATQYFDRLRQLAPSNPRAAELVGSLAQNGQPPAPSANAPLAVTITPPSVPAPVAPAPVAVTSAPAATVAAPLAPSTAVASAPTTPPPAASAPRPSAEFAVASADSDDLIPSTPSAPAKSPAPSPRTVASLTTGGPARPQQVASLSPTTVSDALPTPAISGTAMTAGSNDLGGAAKQVQVAQIEVMPPGPIGGYQLPANVTPYSPSDTLEMDIDRDLIVLESQANPMLVAGVGFRYHDGASGTGQLFEFGTPVEASFSPWYTGTMRFAVLPVWLDSGSLSTNSLSQFGTNPVPFGAGTALGSAGSQNAYGVGLLGGYAYGDFSGQFGTSPLGFPVTNLVGSAAYTPKFFNDTLSVRFEGLRQPVTDSLLSYAGTKANLSAANAVAPGLFGSNPIWGGVVKTGGHVTAFYDDQMYGAYGGAGLASLTGQNVAENSQLDALLGAYFRPWKTDNWAIRVGVSGYYTSFNKNLGFFTFGQGGYFSPAGEESLTFPVEFTGHAGPWSWLASVALGVQHINEDSSLVFPNNPAAQATLVRLGTTTSFAGGSSTGLGVALQGQIEYAIDNTTTVGAAGSFNNGNSYNEVIGKLYLRKTFDWFAPVATKNDPVSIAQRDLPQSHL